MKKVYSDLIQFRGTHYDFGLMQGELLKNSLVLTNRQKQWGPKPHHFIINTTTFQHIIKNFAPGIWDEIHGLADALHWPLEGAIKEFGGYYLEYGRSGCSIFINKGYMIRNYDNHPHSYEGRFLLYQPTDQGYATIGPSMQITGRTDGLNEMGVALGYNFTNRKQSDDGFLCNMIGRIVLENAATVDEAVKLLKEMPHRHSFSYVLVDQSGKSLIVEASPRRVVTREAKACTNHFKHLTKENRYRMEESMQRENNIKREGTKVSNFFEAFHMMNDTRRGIFSSKYGAWAGTLHTTSYQPKELKAGLTLGGDKHPLLVDFSKWLTGENMNITKIKGSLSSSSAFVNIEHL